MSELSDKLATLDITLTSTHLGLREKSEGDSNWLHDEFEVVITYDGKQLVVPSYKMGIGNRKRRPCVKKEGSKYWGTHEQVYAFSDKEACKMNFLIPMHPDLADLLHSLLTDSSAGEMPFVMWASDYGYDPDSRKALDTYLQCQQSYIDLLRVFGGALVSELRGLEH